MEFAPNYLAKPFESEKSIYVPRLKRKIEDLSTEPLLNPKQCFKEIINSILTKVVKTTDDLIKENYKNPDDPYNNDFRLLQIMKNAANVSTSAALRWLQIKPHPNNCCPQLRHIPVQQQFRGTLCGYHALYNAKCMARSLIAERKFTQLANLVNLNNDREFWNHYRRTIKILAD